MLQVQAEDWKSRDMYGRWFVRGWRVRSIGVGIMAFPRHRLWNSSGLTSLQSR